MAESHKQSAVCYRLTRGGGCSSARGRGRFPRNYLGRTEGAQKTFSKMMKCYGYGKEGHLSWGFSTRRSNDARQEARCAQLAKPESKPETLRADRTRLVLKKKVLLACGNKGKSNRD